MRLKGIGLSLETELTNETRPGTIVPGVELPAIYAMAGISIEIIQRDMTQFDGLMSYDVYHILDDNGYCSVITYDSSLGYYYTYLSFYDNQRLCRATPQEVLDEILKELI